MYQKVKGSKKCLHRKRWRTYREGGLGQFRLIGCAKKQKKGGGKEGECGGPCGGGGKKRQTQNGPLCEPGVMKRGVTPEVLLQLKVTRREETMTPLQHGSKPRRENTGLLSDTISRGS